MPAILKVANVHFTQSGNNRLEYTGNGVVRIIGAGLSIPSGNNATRPSGESGIIRYNTDSSTLEFYNNSSWNPLADFGPAFDKANSSNLLAYNVGINTNNYLISVISGANTTIGAGANNYLLAVIAGANSAVGTGANNFASVTIAGANTAVGTGANNFASATIAGANSAVGGGANAFTSATIAGANSAVGTGANNYLLAVIAGANSAVGAGANAYAATISTGANTIAIAAFTKANAALPNATGTFAGALTITSATNIQAGGFTANNNGYGIIGYTSSAASAGVIGYSQNQTKYGILGYNNTYSFYGAGDGYFSGQILATNNITAYYSDRRLKRDIVEIKNSLDLIRQISGVYYKQNDVAKSYGYDSEETQIGVIAQEIQKVIPQAIAPAPFDIKVVDGKVTSKSGENYLTVLPDKIIPVLIQAIKQLDERLSAIEERIK